MKLDTKALVVVEFPTIKSVIRAKVDTKLETKEFVEVELVETRSTKLPLVAEKFVV